MDWTYISISKYNGYNKNSGGFKKCSYWKTESAKTEKYTGKCPEGGQLLNHQMDVNLFKIGKEFQRRFAGEEITKIHDHRGHLESELPVLWLKFLMFRLCLQEKHRPKISPVMFIPQSRIFHPWKSL